jgi:hypothetical protein
LTPLISVASLVLRAISVQLACRAEGARWAAAVIGPGPLAHDVSVYGVSDRLVCALCLVLVKAARLRAPRADARPLPWKARPTPAPRGLSPQISRLTRNAEPVLSPVDLHTLPVVPLAVTASGPTQGVGARCHRQPRPGTCWHGLGACGQDGQGAGRLLLK